MNDQSKWYSTPNQHEWRSARWGFRNKEISQVHSPQAAIFQIWTQTQMETMKFWVHALKSSNSKFLSQCLRELTLLTGKNNFVCKKLRYISFSPSILNIHWCIDFRKKFSGLKLMIFTCLCCSTKCTWAGKMLRMNLHQNGMKPQGRHQRNR